MGRKDVRNVLILLTIGTALRIYALSQTHLIAFDGAFQYLPAAKLFFEGNYLEAFSQPQLPLYPFLISLVTHVTGDLELAGQLLSLVFSVAAVIPLYLLGRLLFTSRAALWTGLLYLVHPLMLRTSVDVLKEGVVIFWFLWAVYLSVKFLRGGHIGWLMLTLVASFVGASVRMTGLIILPALGIWVGYLAVTGRSKERQGRLRLAVIAVALVGLPLILLIPGLLPYHALISKKYYGVAREITGHWPTWGEVAGALLHGLKQLALKIYPVPLVLAVVGLGRRAYFKQLAGEERYLLLLVGATISTFVLRESARYLLPGVFIVYLWSGYGLVIAQNYIQGRMPRHQKRAAAVLIALVFLTMVPEALKPQRFDKVGRKEVGIWLARQDVQFPVVVTNIPRVAYYAGGTFALVDEATLSPEFIVSAALEKRADYIVMELEPEATLTRELTRGLARDMRLRHLLDYASGSDGRMIFVYRVQRSSPR